MAVPALLLWPWAAAAQTAGGATPLEWISGCWEMRSERSTTVERWGDAVGGLLLGTSKTTRGEQVAAWELLRIEASDDGTLTYWAYPSGQSPTTFTAQGSSPDSVTFSNPEHDFPRSVTYRRRPDSLVASIQGETSGGFRQIFFPFTRVPCEG